jgi:hypothetical protein
MSFLSHPSAPPPSTAASVEALGCKELVLTPAFQRVRSQHHSDRRCSHLEEKKRDNQVTGSRKAKELTMADRLHISQGKQLRFRDARPNVMKIRL